MKISIPKDAVDKIVREYHCTEDEAVKAYLDAQEKANDAFNSELDRSLGCYKKTLEDEFAVKSYTPSDIRRYLDKYVIGQQEYKKRLSIAAAYHFATVKYLNENPEHTSVNRFRKKNTITAGPSGSGKTYCAEILGDLLQLPTLIIDATDYTEAGYVGKNADDMVRELIDMAPGSTRKEKAHFINKYGGLIFIDEIDKKAKESNLISHDISREGFQRSILKLIERKLIPIENPYSPVAQFQELVGKRKKQDEPENKDNMVSTENILFILGGSFQRGQNSLDNIVRKRIRSKGRLSEDDTFVIEGFSTSKNGKNTKELRRYYKEATEDDLIKFGLLPEIVGRAPVKTFVNPLSKNDLVRIMKETEDSILNQYTLEFSLFDIKIEFTDDAVEYVAGLAENKQTGARALVSVWEDILTDFQAELPGTNHKKLIVTRELCEKPRDFLLAMLKKSPFLDYIEFFKKEYGVELVLDDSVQKYIEDYAKVNNMELSKTIRTLLAGASALNYMNLTGPFHITKEILEDDKYFDNLFTLWYQQHGTAQ